MGFSKIMSRASAAALASVLMAGSASAITLNFDSTSISSNSPATGASGSVVLSFADEGGDVRVTADITNTTGTITSFGEGATESKLTGFGFDLVAGVSYIDGSFTTTGYLDTLIEDAELSPFGTFDIAAADNNNFLGGNANDALPQGMSTQVSFLFDTTLDALGLDSAFAAAFNDGLKAVMRFQQVNAGEGSDKLLYQPPAPVPLPAAGWLLFGALGGLAFLRRKTA